MVFSNFSCSSVSALNSACSRPRSLSSCCMRSLFSCRWVLAVSAWTRASCSRNASVSNALLSDAIFFCSASSVFFASSLAASISCSGLRLSASSCRTDRYSFASWLRVSMASSSASFSRFSSSDRRCSSAFISVRRMFFCCTVSRNTESRFSCSCSSSSRTSFSS